MSLFGNYNTPGRGVLKAPQEKKGIFKFFEVYGRHMWKLMELNLLYFVFCIPLTLTVILMLMTSNPIWLLLAIPSVLVGPATAAMPEEKERGLMNWYGKGNSVDQKVRSAFMSVEERDGELVGVITAQIYGQLTDEELEEFRSYCEGQLSDGVGESLEQRPIKTPDGDIYVSFWNSDDNWSLQTEEEINSIQSEDLTDEPDIGMTM